MLHRMRTILLLTMCIAMCGCAATKTSNTGRTAMEQMLISNAVDQSLSKVDFRPLAGRNVFLDVQYLDCTDKSYVIAATRDRVLQAGARLAPKAEDADVIVEVRSGAVGTDQTESYVGIPEVALPGPIPIAIPQVKFWSRSTQTGTAKIGLVAYEAGSRTVLGHGGAALARSDDTNTFLLGLGPFQSGSVRKEVHRGLDRPARMVVPDHVAFAPGHAVGEPNRLQLAGSREDAPPAPPAPAPPGIVPLNGTDASP